MALFNAPSGDRLHYVRRGNGPRRLLLLHGFAASLKSWDDLAPLFDPSEFSLYLLDLKGHGGSLEQRDSDYSVVRNSRLVLDFLQAEALDDVTLIGHSLGGAVGMYAALVTPRISRVILIGAPVFPQKIPRFMKVLRAPLVGPLLMALLPARSIARRGLKAVFYRHERINEQLVERYAGSYRSLAASRALSATVRQIIPADAHQIASRYRQFARPVLLIWGAHDRVVKLWQAEQLQQAVPGAVLKVLPECGHNPHEECPQETYGLIRAFLDE